MRGHPPPASPISADELVPAVLDRSDFILDAPHLAVEELIRFHLVPL
jgi:hypothetical protein